MVPHKESRSTPSARRSLEAAANELAQILGIQDSDQRAYLSQQLGDIASHSGAFQSIDAAGPPSKRAKEAHSVESACESILSAFAITGRNFDLNEAVKTNSTAAVIAFQIAKIVRPGRRHHSPLEDEESYDRVAAVLDGVVVVRDAARRTREQSEQEKDEGQGGRRRIEDWPLKQTAWHILRLYMELTGQRPGVSVSPSDGKRGGPAVRFLDATLRWLGLPTKPTTATNLINKLKNDPELLRTQQLTIFNTKKS